MLTSADPIEAYDGGYTAGRNGETKFQQTRRDNTYVVVRRYDAPVAWEVWEIIEHPTYLSDEDLYDRLTPLNTETPVEIIDLDTFILLGKWWPLYAESERKAKVFVRTSEDD